MALPLRAAEPFATDRWVYLDNGQIRLGYDASAGACIGYLSLSGGTNGNFLNHHDRGRFVQQSYYGAEDGTLWGDKPWRWNPVQGGDFKHNPAKVLEERSTATNAYAKSIARHWSGCVDLPDVIFEQWITLTGRVAHVRYRMAYSGTNDHPETTHEIPAVFVNPSYRNLVLYNGPKPWVMDTLHRSVPGWPNESRTISEHWAAYVNENDLGVGAYVPLSTNLTCYIFGDGNPAHGSCSYFAPLTRFAITKGKRFDYDLYLTIGTLPEIRKSFYRLAGKK